MKTKLILILLTILLVSCNGKSDKKKAVIKKSEIVEVYEEPRHKLVYENKDFKILDIQIKPNDTTLFHRHRNPMFYVSLGWQPNDYQLLGSKWETGSSEEWKFGEIDIDSSYLIKPLIHRVTNRGTKPSRLIGILNISNGLKSNDESRATEFTNRWFRSKRIELNSNDVLDFQHLEFPTIIVNLSGSYFEVIKENRTSSYNLKWLVAEEISQLKNSTNHKIELIQIEVLNKASR